MDARPGDLFYRLTIGYTEVRCRMARSIEELFAEASRLSLEERSELAERLLDTLRTDEERKIAAEWAAVAARQAAEIERCEARTVTLEEAMVHARRAVRAVASQRASCQDKT